MKRMVKIFILILSFVISSTAIVGVYAWFTLQPSSDALDIYIRTTELYSADAQVELNGQSIYFDNTLFKSNSLTIELTQPIVSSNLIGDHLPLDIKILLRPLKNIEVRVKMVELWTNTSTGKIIMNPSVFTWDYAIPNRLDNHGYYYHDSTIYKDNVSTIVDFVNGATVNMANFPSNYKVNLSMIVSAVQSNRSHLWNLQDSNHVVSNQKLNITSTMDRSVKVTFTGVSNAQLKRGVYIEFKSSSATYTYLWHERSTMLTNLDLPIGQYDVYINLINHLKFDVTTNGSVITIHAYYNLDMTDWGFEDALYAPSVIAYWNNYTNYSNGSIVYYDDPTGVLSGYYRAQSSQTNIIPGSSGSAWAWESISIKYTNQTVYEAGDVVYYGGVFYKAKQSVPANTPPPTAWAWERLDLLFDSGNTYQLGDITFTESNGVKRWFYAYGSVGAYQSEPKTWQSFRVLGFKFDAYNLTGGKYKANEYVEYDGVFYMSTVDGVNTTPSITSGSWRPIRQAYVAKLAYATNTITLHNSNYYYASANISANQAPGSNVNWRLIQHMGNHNPNVNYTRYQSVTFNGQTYFWNSTDASVNTNPLTNSNWWIVGTDWSPNNIYAQHQMVTHNNKTYVSRTAIAKNQEPGVNGAWQLLSEEWSKTSIYANNNRHRSMVTYQGKIFLWTGENNTNSLAAPGTEQTYWVEITSNWSPYNTYAIGDYVKYDGSFWEMVAETYPTNQTRVPGIDFSVWKEHQINWDPNRN